MPLCIPHNKPQRCEACEADAQALADVRTLDQARYIVTVGWSFDGTERTISLWGKRCPDAPFTAETVEAARALAAAWVREQAKGAE